MIHLYRVYIRQQTHKDWQEIELDYPTKGMADMAASCAESALKLAGLSFAQATVRAREVDEAVLEGAFKWTGRTAAEVIRDAWQQLFGDTPPSLTPDDTFKGYWTAPNPGISAGATLPDAGVKDAGLHMANGGPALHGGFASYVEQNTPGTIRFKGSAYYGIPDVDVPPAQSRHISLGEQSHKVSVTGMTKCKVCDTRIVAGRTFYFFGADGPYCEACYAKDERRQKW